VCVAVTVVSFPDERALVALPPCAFVIRSVFVSFLVLFVRGCFSPVFPSIDWQRVFQTRLDAAEHTHTRSLSFSVEQHKKSVFVLAELCSVAFVLFISWKPKGFPSRQQFPHAPDRGGSGRKPGIRWDWRGVP